MDGKWIKDLRQLAGNYEGKVPEGLLDDIKQEMKRRGETAGTPPQKQPMLLQLHPRRIAVAAAVALAAGVGLWEALPRKAQPDTALTSKIRLDSPIPVSEASQQASADDAVPSTCPDDALPAHSGLRQRLGTLLAAATSRPHYNASNQNPTAAETRQPAESQMVAQANTEQSRRPQQQPVKESEHPLQPSTRQEEDYQPARSYGWRDEESHHAVSIGLALAGATGSNHSGSGITLMSAEPIGLSYPQDFSAKTTTLFAAGKSDLKEKSKHNLPLKVGLSVSYAINDRWSLHSGVDYSYLKSTFTTSDVSSTSTTSQKLHYVGIPLGARYNVWRWKGLNTYVGAGGEAEKLVSGKAATTRVTRNIVTPSSKNLKEKQLLWSTYATAGVELKPVDHVSIYAEPGVTYHFKNGSSIESAYTDKRLSFSLHIGARIHFGND